MKTIKYTPTEGLLALDEGERIRWAIALESGEYTQGKNTLFDGKDYCCLGVWESINGREDEEMQYKMFPRSMDDAPIPLGNTLPEHITFAVSGDEEEDEPLNASRLNDNRGLAFPEIAQLLRGNPVTKEASE